LRFRQGIQGSLCETPVDPPAFQRRWALLQPCRHGLPLEESTDSG
jgi:hypothetical protein